MLLRLIALIMVLPFLSFNIQSIFLFVNDFDFIGTIAKPYPFFFNLSNNLTCGTLTLLIY